MQQIVPHVSTVQAVVFPKQKRRWDEPITPCCGVAALHHMGAVGSSVS